MRVRIELKHSWPAIRTGEALSCGGSQNWFADENFRLCGCGVIAAADTLLYLRGIRELPQKEYLRYVNQMRRFFPLIPHRGIDGIRLSLGLNRCLRKEGLRVSTRWSASGAPFWDRLERQLVDDLPAIVAVGPNFPKVWGTERLTLYRAEEDGSYVPAERTRGHFLTVIGMDETWLRVSSWGRELYIERRAYESYMRRNGALFTNLLRLERRE